MPEKVGQWRCLVNLAAPWTVLKQNKCKTISFSLLLIDGECFTASTWYGISHTTSRFYYWGPFRGPTSVHVRMSLAVNFKTLRFTYCSEEKAMSLSVFYHCICVCLRRCRSFNPSLCRLSPFHLSYVVVSRPCRLSKFTLTGPHY